MSIAVLEWIAENFHVEITYVMINTNNTFVKSDIQSFTLDWPPVLNNYEIPLGDASFINMV